MSHDLVVCPLCTNSYLTDMDPHRCYRWEPKGWGKPHNGRLLIMACSETKTDDPGTVPAFERYNGPLWQTYRSVDPGGQRARVGFVSAAYGFGRGGQQLPQYNARLTADTAQQMIARGIWERWPATASKPGRIPKGDCPGTAMRWLTSVGSEDRAFADVALVGGELYLRVMRAYLSAFRSEGAITAKARITEINGSIGQMRRDLRTWLLTP